MSTSALLRKGLLLEYITLAWNVVGCGIAIWTGVLAGSLALIGFGIDSAIEM